MTLASLKNDQLELTTISSARAARWLDLAEIWRYRDLLSFMIRRDIKTLYAQSVLGIGWAVIQPIFSMVVFSIVFGRIAGIGSEGVPYPIFAFTALVPWTYFSNSLAAASGSVVNASAMITKVYFPRVLIPLAPILAKLVDLLIAGLILVGMLAWYGFAPNLSLAAMPLLLLIMIISALGMGMWTSALATHYRDVKHAMNFLIQLLMYAAPVVYPASRIPDGLRLLYAVNPMSGVIEGFRAALLGTTPMPWDMLAVGGSAALLMAISGGLYFKRMEYHFADVI